MSRSICSAWSLDVLRLREQSHARGRRDTPPSSPPHPCQLVGTSPWENPISAAFEGRSHGTSGKTVSVVVFLQIQIYCALRPVQLLPSAVPGGPRCSSAGPGASGGGFPPAAAACICDHRSGVSLGIACGTSALYPSSSLLSPTTTVESRASNSRPFRANSHSFIPQIMQTWCFSGS